MPAPYKQLLDTLGKTGDFKDNVLKVNIRRNDADNGLEATARSAEA